MQLFFLERTNFMKNCSVTGKQILTFLQILKSAEYEQKTFSRRRRNHCNSTIVILAFHSRRFERLA